MGHDNVRFGAQARDNSVVVGGVEVVGGGGRRDWIIVKEVGARVMVLCNGSSGAWVGDNLAVVGGAETVAFWGKGCGMVVVTSHFYRL